MSFYPGKIEGMWGDLASFPFTPVESVLSVGIVALLGLLFFLGLKHLELLPAQESSEAPAPPRGSVSTGEEQPELEGPHETQDKEESI